MPEEISKEVLALNSQANSIIEVENRQYELEVKQVKALSTLAEGVKELSQFLTQGGLATMLSAYSKELSVGQMLGGLASHLGRGALDAQTIKQNALEITELIEAVRKKSTERLAATNRDPEIHDAESPLKAFEDRMKAKNG